jgi:hypothetical protein
MRSSFWVVAVCGALLAVSGNVAAQAAAESALTHALSSSAGNTLGKAMGNATGQLAGKLGQQTSNAVSRPRPSTTKLGSSAVVKPATTSTATPSPSGSLIASIQGSASPVTNCAPAKQTADANPTKTDPAAAESHPVTANCAPSSSQDSETHPAVLNLPPAK